MALAFATALHESTKASEPNKEQANMVTGSYTRDAASG